MNALALNPTIENAAASIYESPAFRRWFGDSMVVDAEGKPLVIFHGTTSTFSTFSDDFIGEGDGNNDWGDGFYFTDRADAAAEYAEGQGGNVMPVYLAMQNPATNIVMLSDEIQNVLDDGMGFEDVAEVLSGMGYDGVAFTHKDGGTEYVVFRPEQIKSATGNNGDYDINNPDICR